MLTVSSDGIAAPGFSRAALLLPVVMEIAGLAIRLTVPNLAVQLALIGVPSLTSSNNSISVGSSFHARTTVTLPTVIPPYNTAEPGSTPPA
jgi:hypothetical protein